ncbi:MAG TPA: HEPN domain-containing protein [Thermoguttaceae bacterium]|nr:HEPN domain-containing protein [Thermoguttaceae bacterium]
MTEIGHFIAKAEKFLRTAEQTLQIGDYDSCVSRSYYAMFYIAQAVLMIKNLTASSHRGVIRTFNKHFVQTGIFDRHIGKSFTNAYDKRLAGDYVIDSKIQEEEAKELLVSARKFVDALKNYLKKEIGEEY